MNLGQELKCISLSHYHADVRRRRSPSLHGGDGAALARLVQRAAREARPPPRQAKHRGVLRRPHAHTRARCRPDGNRRRYVILKYVGMAILRSAGSATMWQNGTQTLFYRDSKAYLIICHAMH